MHAESWAWVYPRVCGGTLGVPADVSLTEGLSPRVRGNLSLPASAGLTHGSIPACAGEPQACRHSSSAGWVYPRVCGGTIRDANVYDLYHGLSPRVRGNLQPASPTTCTSRSIPACAGEPAVRNRLSLRVGVYPRVCGGTSDCTVVRQA